MLKISCEKLQKKENLRETLQLLRNEAKDGEKAEELRKLLGDGSLLRELLREEEPKVRKNAALLLGDLKMQQAAGALWEAYQRETTLFVKSSYLAALGKLEAADDFAEPLRQRMETLSQLVPAENEKKHVNEEIREMSKLLTRIEGVKKHTFRGFQNPHEMVLTTNHSSRNVTAGEAAELSEAVRRTVKPHPLGVLVCTKEIQPFARLRTYRELLFPIHGKGDLHREPEAAAADIWQSDLWDFLTECHKEESPFYFRLELKTKMDLAERSSYARKFSAELERISNRRLINSTGDYEIEIRLLESRDGKRIPFLKLFTIQDKRFSYRKHAVASSIHPAAAAMLVRLAQPYLKEDARILDPFCGVGTMLVERDILVPAREKYGIDIFGEAVEGARENAGLAGEKINFIHRDYFDFTHKYLFDEIITNMPVRGKKSKGEMDDFYAAFFEKSGTLLSAGGKIIFYSNEEGFVKKQLRLHCEYRLLQEFCIREKEHFYLYIVEVKG